MSIRASRAISIIVFGATIAAAWTFESSRAADTQVYKTVDAQGNVVYTDKPSNRDTSKTSVRVHEPSAADMARVEKQRQDAESANVQRLQETLADKANRDREQKEKQDRCQRARKLYYALKDATRLFERDAQGNRVYLPDEDAEARREEARKAMEAACAP